MVVQENHYFSESEANKLFQNWKKTKDIVVLNDLLILCIPLIQKLIGKKRSYEYEDPKELESLVLQKLSRSLQNHYAPEKGRMFSFVTTCTERALIDALRRRKQYTNRLTSIEEPPDSIDEALHSNGQHSREYVDDMRAA